MEESLSYLERLETALKKKAHFIEDKRMPALREALSVYQTLFQNLYNILLRKSLIKEDPYQYEKNIQEINPPPRGNFLESEKQEKLSQRLSDFHAQLDFLIHYYQFSLDFITLDRLRRIVSLVQYIDWQRLTEQSSNMTTGVLAEFLTKVRLGTDNISTGIINDSVTQLRKTVQQILSILKEISVYQREAYKFDIHKIIISQIPEVKTKAGGEETAEAVSADQEEMLKKIKMEFRQQMGNSPFYPELAREAATEYFSDGSKDLQASVLSKLDLSRDKPKKKKKGPEYKSILLEAVRVMALSGSYLMDAIRKLNDNRIMLETRKRGLLSRFKRWIKKMAQKASEAKIMEIEYLDNVTGTMKVEKINFTAMIESTQKKARLFSIISNRMSTAFQRLEAASENQIFEFLNKNLRELQIIHRRSEGLNTYFRSEVPKEEKGRIKGIKIELGTIKNIIIRTNKQKHEYIFQKEEEEQMKKLGIKMNED